jgi:Flp pilus assembly protein TadG
MKVTRTDHHCLLVAFHRDQRGAAYSISVVLILPMYLAFIAFAIEIVLLMNSHQALTAGLKSSAHSVRAWTLHREALGDAGQTLEERVKSAMKRTMIPFATTHAQSDGQIDTALQTFLLDSGLTPQAARRYAQKSMQIDQNLRLQIRQETRDTSGYSVAAEYDSPLWIPFFRPLLANGPNSDQAARTLSAEIWVPVPSAEIDRAELGITYSVDQSRNWANDQDG